MPRAKFLGADKTLVNNQQVDAFGRVRVANPFVIFDSKQVGDKRSIFWDELITGSGGLSTYNIDASETILSVGTSVASVIRQTFRRFNYQPGKSQFVMMTGVLDASGGGTGVVQALGYFDDNNGLFFQNKEGAKQVVIRSKSSGSVVDAEFNQADWNIDTMDGTGPSGHVVDWTKTQIFFIDFEWLGVGTVRFGLWVNNDVYYFHIVDHSNVDTDTYMGVPNLPARYSLEQDGNGTAASIEVICTSIQSEGGQNPTGILRSASTSGVALIAVTAKTVIYACLGIKLKSTHLAVEVVPKSISMISESNQDFEWLLILNPTIEDTFTYADLDPESAVQFATGVAANTVTNGLVLRSGFAKTNTIAEAAAIHDQEALGSTIGGVAHELVLCVRGMGNNTSVQASFGWVERI